MPHINKEDLPKIREIDVLSYLQRCRPDELVKLNSRVYTTKSHDSLKISNGKWMWWSQGFGGKNALDYMTKVEGKTFLDAALILANAFGIHSYGTYIPEKKKTPEIKKERQKPPDKLELPIKADDNDIVIAYLRNRGISQEVIDYCIANEMLYQAEAGNMAVFVGFDEHHTPKYATQRSTGEIRYFKESYGSDKAYACRIVNPSGNSLHLFEGVIDLLSFATLLQQQGKRFWEFNLLSLGGVAESCSKLPEPIVNFLSQNQQIRTVYLHLDNDEAGVKATAHIRYILDEKYKTVNHPVPPQYKDVNDYLQMKTNKEKERDR